VLVDGKGRIRGIYNATLELEMEKLIRHIRILKEEEALE
jgi:protein SCO1/2